MVHMLGEALGQVPLTATQRTQIEKLASEAEARQGDAGAVWKDLTSALADQVQAGRVDRAALQPRIDAFTAALQRSQPADRAALEQLHALLSADQRAAFVDALTANVREHKGAARDTHGTKWADDLKLTDEQKAQVRLALRQAHASRESDSHEPGRAPGGDHPWAGGGHHAAVLSAFRQDRFVIDEVAPPHDLSAVAASASDRVLRMAEAVLPLLTPEQRAVAAQRIREHGSSPEGMGTPL
jgi:Spy/CpxP family protein refolding chaperone